MGARAPTHRDLASSSRRPRKSSRRLMAGRMRRRQPRANADAQNFQHEAFPVPFPLLVRAYSSLFGRSDFALRGFGILAALALLCAMWWTAKFTGHGPPLLALALIGLNATVLFWGTTVRGYGLGAAFIIAAFGSFAALLLKLTTPRLIIAGVVSVATVQCLVHNLALIAAFVAGATIVALLLHDFKRLVAFLGILALCLISFVPYLGAYSSSWSEVVEFPVSARLLWNQLAFALGNPNAALAWLWRLAFIVLIIAAALPHFPRKIRPMERSSLRRDQRNRCADCLLQVSPNPELSHALLVFHRSHCRARDCARLPRGDSRDQRSVAHRPITLRRSCARRLADQRVAGNHAAPDQHRHHRAKNRDRRKTVGLDRARSLAIRHFISALLSRLDATDHSPVDLRSARSSLRSLPRENAG